MEWVLHLTLFRGIFQVDGPAREIRQQETISPSCMNEASAPRLIRRLWVKNPALCQPAISERWNGPGHEHVQTHRLSTGLQYQTCQHGKQKHREITRLLLLKVLCHRWQGWQPCHARAVYLLSPWWAGLDIRYPPNMYTDCPNTSVSVVLLLVSLILFQLPLVPLCLAFSWHVQRNQAAFAWSSSLTYVELLQSYYRDYKAQNRKTQFTHLRPPCAMLKSVRCIRRHTVQKA